MYWVQGVGFPSGSVVKNLPAIQESQEMWVRFLGRKDAREESMATHSSVLAWRIPWRGAWPATVDGVAESDGIEVTAHTSELTQRETVKALAFTS